MGGPWRSIPLGRATLAFGTILLILAAAGFAGMHLVPALAFSRQEAPRMRPPDPTWFPVFYRGGEHMDQTIFWNGFGESIESARRADVLLLGTSQILFAVRAHEMRAFEKRSGLSIFNLGFPFGEGYAFPLKLIERFDLRPAVVVVNVTEFFKHGESIPAAKAIRDGWWTGFTTVLEERLAAVVWPVASRVLPSYLATRASKGILRSSESGAWMPMRWPHAHRRVGARPVPTEIDYPSARRFRRALATRGIALVLTCTPSVMQDCPPAAMRKIAAEIGATAVVPTVDRPLWTTDFAHLCPLSGKRFGRALLREVEKHPAVRAAAAQRARHAVGCRAGDCA